MVLGELVEGRIDEGIGIEELKGDGLKEIVEED